jgi:predicted dehydrogenase
MLKVLSSQVKFVSVRGRLSQSARKLGERLGVPWYADIEKLMEDTDSQIGIVSVNYRANGIVGQMAVEHGLHVLLETPIAHKLSEADAIIHEARQRGRPMAVLISVGDLQRFNHSAEMVHRLAQALGQSPELLERLKSGEVHPIMAAFGLWKDNGPASSNPRPLHCGRKL